MPAALAASTPAGLPSITAQRVGSTPSVRAACRNRSGAGLPRVTSCALKMRPAKRSKRPVVVSASRSRSCEPLEATHAGTAMRPSASVTPGIGVSPVAKASKSPAW
jgi:hypothetical protein